MYFAFRADPLPTLRVLHAAKYEVAVGDLLLHSLCFAGVDLLLRTLYVAKFAVLTKSAIDDWFCLSPVAGVDLLPTLRVLYAEIAACCSSMATAMKYRRGLQRVRTAGL